jgi:ABC-type branched-subunit amino acid transport system permease subunit
MMHPRWRYRLLLGQAGYYLATGLWPLVHLPSFEALTGPKTDDWLVRMVGCLAVVIGATLGAAAVRRREHAFDIVVLAAGSALAFASIDTWYAAVGRIAPIYLADAVLELGVLAGLALTRDR